VLNRDYYWPGLAKEVKEYIKSCLTCATTKSSNQRPAGLLQPLPIPSRRWEQVTFDLITALPKTKRNHTAIAVWVDKLSKMVHLAPCTTEVTAVELADLCYREIVRYHGVPASIVSDRDPRFTANFWQALWALLGTKLKMSTSYHPQSDGQTENTNKTLENMLRAYVNNSLSDWDDYLVSAEIAINNSTQASTGYSPFWLNSGQSPNLPLSTAARASHQDTSVNQVANEWVRRVEADLERARENLQRAQQAQQKEADKHRRAVSYAVGDSVLLSTANLTSHNSKLRAKFIGPFPIKEVRSDVTVVLELPRVMSRRHPVFHVNLLRPFTEDPTRFPNRRQVNRPVAELVDRQKEWVVERVLGEREVRNGQMQYLVLWEGWPVEDATWEPASYLTHAQEVINDWKEQQSDEGVVLPTVAVVQEERERHTEEKNKEEDNSDPSLVSPDDEDRGRTDVRPERRSARLREKRGSK
jgi:hypothetical protein